jgi:hypothetical protein
MQVVCVALATEALSAPIISRFVEFFASTGSNPSKKLIVGGNTAKLLGIA